MLDSHQFELYLIRHGQTDINLSNQMGQVRSSPLNKTGEHQAQLLKQKFDKEKLVFDAVYCSTYDRAQDTARILMQDYHFPARTVEDLKEYNAGYWLGKDRGETLTPDILFKMNALGQAFQPPNGESLNEVQRRAAKWLDDTLVYNKIWIDISQEKRRKGLSAPNIAVVSHGMTIKCLLQFIMGFDRTFTWRISIDNTSVSHLSFSDVGWKLHSINDCSHLK